MKTTNEVLKEIIDRLKAAADNVYMYDDYTTGMERGYSDSAELVEEYLDITEED